MSKSILIASVAILPLIISSPSFADTASNQIPPVVTKELGRDLAKLAITLNEENAKAFVDSVIEQARATLADKNLTAHSREVKFRTLLDDSFDMPRISKFVLGPRWNQATEQERQDFVHVFNQYIVHSYSKDFGDFSGEEIKVTRVRLESETVATVISQFQPSTGGPVVIAWRVSNKDNTYKIIDVDVEGVSLLVTHREELGTVLSQHGGSISELNKILAQKIAD
jgi:phospholipid transport system substrate-binding protein